MRLLLSEGNVWSVPFRKKDRTDLTALMKGYLSMTETEVKMDLACAMTIIRDALIQEGMSGVYMREYLSEE